MFVEKYKPGLVNRQIAADQTLGKKYTKINFKERSVFREVLNNTGRSTSELEIEVESGIKKCHLGLLNLQT